jgi:hypothetical protein
MRREPRRTRHRCLGTYVSNGTIYDYWMVSPRKTALSPRLRRDGSDSPEAHRCCAAHRAAAVVVPALKGISIPARGHSRMQAPTFMPKYLVDRWFDPLCATAPQLLASASTGHGTHPEIGYTTCDRFSDRRGVPTRPPTTHMPRRALNDSRYIATLCTVPFSWRIRHHPPKRWDIRHAEWDPTTETVTSQTPCPMAMGWPAVMRGVSLDVHRGLSHVRVQSPGSRVPS